MTSTERLFDRGPTPEQIAASPGSWFVPEHLREQYREAAQHFTPRQIVERENVGQAGGGWDTGLLNARATARALAGLPPLGSKDSTFHLADRAWPTDVHSLVGYLLHLDALKAAEDAHHAAEQRRQQEAEHIFRKTCRVCDTFDDSTSEGLCADCRNTVKVICDDKIEASAEQRVTRLKTRRQLVEDYLSKNPERLPRNLYEAIMRTEHLN